MLLKRLLTAAVLLGLLLAVLLLAPAWAFFLVLLLFGLLALWEYLELVARASSPPPRWPVYLVAVGVWVVGGWFSGHLLAAILVGGLLLFVSAVWGSREVAEILPAAAAGVFALLILAAPFALLLDLRSGTDGQWVILYLFVVVWVGDTAAYFVGKAVGRHQLVPRLSPAKTVEGTAASLVAAVAVSFFLFRSWFPFTPAHGLFLGIIVNVAAQFSDLAESALKRSAGVKDSSALLPGHGGVLDRIDSLLFAIPALWYYWNLLMRGGF